MAADKTVEKAAHVTLTANTAYTINLTGAGRYIDIIAHSHGSHNDVYFATAATEADLPTITAGADNTYIAHADERIRVPAPRNTWIRLISGSGMDASVVKISTIF